MKYCLLWIVILASSVYANPTPDHFMQFDDLATRWDEAVPLGNGMVGALIWQEGETLRFSLDRADLWDSRPVENFQKPEFRFDWMYDHVKNGNIKPVQDLIDRPYSKDPAPTKIPAARLEFDQSNFGKVNKVTLDIANAICTVTWENGITLDTFVHATEPCGWFRFTNVNAKQNPTIIPPPFGGEVGDLSNVNSLNTPPLSALGYPDPEVIIEKDHSTYTQQGWGDFKFAVHCEWIRQNNELIGIWSIISTETNANPKQQAIQTAHNALQKGYSHNLGTHKTWWKQYWDQSTIQIPDDVLEKQWYLEQYKFGSATRRGAPPITLQAVWTADEQRIPPWKGDYHHDLNTQLSYWPCYSSNRLEEGLAFLDWLWKVKPANETFTQQFYGHKGLNVPGTTTLDGAGMGGWNQYSFSPTTSAWLAHHFYLHWRYSMDRKFLQDRGYPYLKAVATFLENHSVLEDRKRRLPLSSSPEINDNRIDAWFHETTNYDLALVRWLFAAAANMADELDYKNESNHWKSILDQWPQLALDKNDRKLLVAPDYPLEASHRHFSHLMAFHPLGLVDIGTNAQDRETIESSMKQLEQLGPDWWCGYSYAWVGGMYARARQAENAANALQIFANCFTSINSFHLNGDQTKSGKSRFQYRPFTLEGNFAFASSMQEMLIQSHTDVIHLFPAIPTSWKEASFKTLRTEGAFLVSAKQKDGIIQEIEITSEAGGPLKLYLPNNKKYTISGIANEKITFHSNTVIIETEIDTTIKFLYN
jgi:alpha-L-fucosidase 2